jgi:hypothetical protein
MIWVFKVIKFLIKYKTGVVKYKIDGMKDKVVWVL